MAEDARPVDWVLAGSFPSRIDACISVERCTKSHGTDAPMGRRGGGARDVSLIDKRIMRARRVPV